ncbi:hypothetical protein GCM10008090_12680 [Arenicella chitinivorans]|uniref:Uncharacterized protein n=1 Tax=Arenicella chitinivorans TaxID=1329800 RepID=A0A918RLT9_9GAMM|nr:hypothetical protein [Arenicella chitinivorans]GHA04717.1 hypothetical protein GCM10008090_12680 [Arenicella chitinivorans]
MHNVIYWLKVALINVAVLFVLLELTAFSIYRIQYGANFYQHPPQVELLPEVVQGRVALKKYLHPYFGYLNYPPGARFGNRKYNNFGFHSAGVDYPYVKSAPNEYVIGIFGGSVAQQIFVKSRADIIRGLKADERFKDKEIVVLTFAQGGYKQPQQLQLLTYFLSIGQQFDTVINLDGFNEIVLSEKNSRQGLSITMPSAGHMLEMMDILNQSELSSEKIEALADISRLKRKINRMAESANQSKLACSWLWATTLRKRAYRTLNESIVAYQSIPSRPSEDSVVYLNPSLEPLTRDQALEKAADYWRDASILMHKVATANNIKYVHILQPNQYFGNRVFGPEESNVAIDHSHNYSANAIEGYPRLAARIDDFEQHGVHFASGLGIMDSEPGMVYADACCHFNSTGTKLIAEFIVKQVLDAHRYPFKSHAVNLVEQVVDAD